jgi:hypothetical protein
MGEDQKFERVGNAIFETLCILTRTEILKTYECCSRGLPMKISGIWDQISCWMVARPPQARSTYGSSFPKGKASQTL